MHIIITIFVILWGLPMACFTGLTFEVFEKWGVWEKMESSKIKFVWKLSHCYLCRLFWLSFGVGILSCIFWKDWLILVDIPISTILAGRLIKYER